ncbi:MAG: YicC family protein [Candidatus Omnitrophica bacterium]|nr:YicC family protein [Candidatus Omnitrophota bacterium]
MLNSMTGFGAKEIELEQFGKIRVELRSINHKFLEVVLHAPEGFLSLEDKIKRQVEGKLKRGRITCVVSLIGSRGAKALINKPLLKNYISLLNEMKREFHLESEVDINTLIHLPGVLGMEENKVIYADVWPRLKGLVDKALEELVKTRQKEGCALAGFLKKRAANIDMHLKAVELRYKKSVQGKLKKLITDEERAVFFMYFDISKELERLSFHVKNFKQKIAKGGVIGKELDFIAQEMQRESNTLAAKSFDVGISARVIQMKGQVEKIREQVQNVE